MASASSSKPPCATCGNKSVGVFKCEGCSQTFCRKHSNEHRDSLTHQLDEIVLEHDTLQQTIGEQKEKPNDRYRLIEQINKWENNSIVKIQQAANEVRQQVEQLITAQNDTISSKLHDLAARLRKAREDDDFVETDLRLWTKKLEELKIDIVDVPPAVIIREDPSVKFIAKLNIKSITQRTEQDENLVRVCGSVRIQDKGRVAIQKNTGVSYVHGKNEYSFGRHSIRFNVNKIELNSTTVFGIISKTETFPQSPSSLYGWKSNDATYQNGILYDNNSNVGSDLRRKTSFTIDLLLDCDNRKIQYFNEETENRRELNVDLTKCPLPWQIFFYLYSAGDRVQLL